MKNTHTNIIAALTLGMLATLASTPAPSFAGPPPAALAIGGSSGSVAIKVDTGDLIPHNEQGRHIELPGMLDPTDDMYRRAGKQCAADWDESLNLDSNDVSLFLNDYMWGHADFNADGDTNSTDMGEFLHAFMAGCP